MILWKPILVGIYEWTSKCTSCKFSFLWKVFKYQNTLLNYTYTTARIIHSHLKIKKIVASRTFTHYSTDHNMFADCIKNSLPYWGATQWLKTKYIPYSQCCYVSFFAFITSLVISISKIHNYEVNKILMPFDKHITQFKSKGVCCKWLAYWFSIPSADCEIRWAICWIPFQPSDSWRKAKWSLLAVLIKYSNVKFMLPFYSNQ
jgi:hypothetical protein